MDGIRETPEQGRGKIFVGEFLTEGHGTDLNHKTEVGKKEGEHKTAKRHTGLPVHEGSVSIQLWTIKNWRAGRGQ